MATQKDLEALRAALSYVAEKFHSRVASLVNRTVQSARDERIDHVKQQLDDLYDE